ISRVLSTPTSGVFYGAGWLRLKSRAVATGPPGDRVSPPSKIVKLQALHQPRGSERPHRHPLADEHRLAWPPFCEHVEPDPGQRRQDEEGANPVVPPPEHRGALPLLSRSAAFPHSVEEADHGKRHDEQQRGGEVDCLHARLAEFLLKGREPGAVRRRPN